MSYNKAIFSKDFTNKSMTIEKVFNAPLAKVWEYYSDGEKMAKWWGPETWPATSISFDFRDGGHWHYCMTGPDGTKAYGYINYLKIEPMKGFHAKDYFSNEEGTVDESLPETDWVTTFEEIDGKTKLTIVNTYESAEAMQKLVEMGFEEGFTSALTNLDKLLEI